MKKIYFLSFIVLSTLISFAQPTLTSTNFSPAIGDTQLYYIADISSNLDTSIGANVLFDYSGLLGTGLTQTTRFVSPTSTTFGSDFISSSYSDTTDGIAVNKRYAQVVGLDSIINTGLVLDVNNFGVTLVKFNVDPEKTMVFPFMFGDSFVDTYAGQFTSIANNITTNGNGVVEMSADAWGTLRMPNIADITGVLRVVQTDSIITDIINLPPPFPPILPITVTSKIISYYKPSLSKFALLSFIEGNSAGQVSRNVISQFFLPAVSVKELENEISLNLFPNPTNRNISTLRFNLKNATNIEIYILNQLGQQVKTVVKGILPSGLNNVVIAANELPKGIYFVNLFIDNQLITKKLIVQ